MTNGEQTRSSSGAAPFIECNIEPYCGYFIEFRGKRAVDRSAGYSLEGGVNGKKQTPFRGCMARITECDRAEDVVEVGA